MVQATRQYAPNRLGALGAPVGYRATAMRPVRIVDTPLGWLGLDRPSLSNPTVLLGFVLLVVIGLQAWNTSRTQPQGDFWNVRAIGRLTASTSDIYSEGAQVILAAKLAQDVAASNATARERRAAAYWTTLQAVNTPGMYAVTGILQSGDWELDSGIFAFLSIASILLAIAWLCRRLSFPPGGALLAMAVVLGANSAMFLDLWVGSFNALQVGILVAYLALRSGNPSTGRNLASAILLGFVIALKPNIALIAAVVLASILVERRWRDLTTQVVGLVGGGLLALSVATLRFGSIEPWFAWLATWRDLAFRDYWKMEWGNFSIIRWIWEETTADLSRIALVGLIGVTALAFLVGRRRVAGSIFGSDASVTDDRRFGRELLLVAAAIGITLLASPLAHQHYYLLLTPAALFLLRPAGERFGGSGRAGFRQGASVVAMILISVWLVEAFWQGDKAVPYLLSYVGAAALLFAVGTYELAMDRRVEEVREIEMENEAVAPLATSPIIGAT